MYLPRNEKIPRRSISPLGSIERDLGAKPGLAAAPRPVQFGPPNSAATQPTGRPPPLPSPNEPSASPPKTLVRKEANSPLALAPHATRLEISPASNLQAPAQENISDFSPTATSRRRRSCQRRIRAAPVLTVQIRLLQSAFGDIVVSSRGHSATRRADSFVAYSLPT